jgi:hypothetical protein
MIKLNQHRSAQEVQSTATLDAELSDHRTFGDSDYLRERFEVSQQRCLEKLAISLPVASELLDALDHVDRYRKYRVIGDTILRCAIRQALRRVMTGDESGLPLDKCEEILRRTISHLTDGRRCGALAAGALRVNRLGKEWYHGWVWSEDQPENIFTETFRQVVQENYGSSLCTPDSKEVSILQKGAQLLAELLPRLTRGVLSHTHLVAIFPPADNWKGVLSISQIQIGGTIFLGRESLKNPWCVAEHLLHESLHQKLYEFRHGHTLFVRDSSPGEDALKTGQPCGVVVPWNSPGLDSANYWDTFRAVAAFHVYVHLALLCTLAEQRAGELEEVYGPLHDARPGMTRARTAFDRAHYLGENIKQFCWPELGRAGQLFIEWLSSILDAFDPSPPPRGASLHLLLHRYLTEAKRIERQRITPEFDRQLGRLTEDEAASAVRILSALSAHAKLERFNKALTNLRADEFTTRFSGTRRLIADTLLDLSPDGYGLKCSSLGSVDPDEIVRDMVETSSRKLAAAGQALEAAVQ